MELALGRADFSPVRALAIDEGLSAKRHDYITLAADAVEQRVIAVIEGRDAATVAAIAEELAPHGCPLEQINRRAKALVRPVMRSKVEPMKEVAELVRRHLEGIVAWAQTRQTNGFLETLKRLFQVAKRRARGYTRIGTVTIVNLVIAGKLDFAAVNPHAR